MYIQRLLDETKVILTEHDKPIEYWVERTEIKEQVGHIYKGKVENVLPGMEACFVDIGTEKNAFLHVNEAYPINDINRFTEERLPPIQQLVTQGEEVLVQIQKEATGTKGPKVTTNLNFPGRYLVYMPFGRYVGVSRKITSEEERERLKQLGESFIQDREGLILRTACAEVSEAELKQDIDNLRDQWHALQKEAHGAQPKQLIYEERDVLSRIVRDLLTVDVHACVVNDRSAIQTLQKKVQHYPELESKIQLYTEKENMLDFFGLRSELDKALRRKVWLKNGAYLIIDHTEALTSIDVNTGKFTGKQNLEQTIRQTNLEATREIARQLRLRDIGGIIIIDFIDMSDEEGRSQVLRALGQAVKQDRTKTTVVGFTSLGLVELTRKKMRQSLRETLMTDCPQCEGTGKAFSTATIVSQVKELIWDYRHLDTEAMLLQVHPQLEKALNGEYKETVKHLEKEVGYKLYFYRSPTQHRDNVSILLYGREAEVSKKLQALVG
nr:Rne/Rng family ribonuclease [Caldalkalibacillus salinus]